MKNLLAMIVLGASMAIAVPQAAADGDTHTHKRSLKKTSAKSPSKAAADADNEIDPKESDLAGAKRTEYSCELGNRLTIYKSAGDDKSIALRWKNRLHRMQRIGTTTGANRFETRKHGLVWIGLPSKGILLNSKKGSQLANECKDPQQLAMSRR